MKLRLGVCVLAMAFVAGCGRKGDVTVSFKGHTPVNGLTKDDRSVSFACPACGAAATADAKKCSVKKCEAAISWQKEDRTCAYCSGTGQCTACRLMNQAEGKCYNCRGHGFLTMQGKTPACPSCKGKDGRGTGKCAACKDKAGACDFCEGKGQITLSTLKSRQAKAPAESP